MRSSLVMVVVLVGCGGSVTTVDGNKNTGTLQPADQNQLCLDTYNYIRNSLSTNDIAELSCGFQQTSTQSSSCQATYQSCVATAQQNAQQINWPLVPDCTSFNASIAKCNTTVDEYTKCLRQEMTALKSIESNFPLCTQAQEQSAFIAAENNFTVDCIQLLQTCQIAFVPASSGSSSGGGPDAGAPDGG